VLLVGGREQGIFLTRTHSYLPIIDEIINGEEQAKVTDAEQNLFCNVNVEILARRFVASKGSPNCERCDSD
jgi:hypothetical protein